MLRKSRNAAGGALLLLVLAGASHRAVAQDTSRAGPDTSAYTGGSSRDTTDTTLRTGVERVDTTARPGQAGGMSDTSVTTDTSAIQPTPGDSTDSTKIGDTTPRRLRHAHRRLHATDSTTAAGQNSGASGATDTSGMAGRHSTDSTRTGQQESPAPSGQPGNSSDSTSGASSTPDSTQR
jgi:hypothetical protein